VLLFVCRSSDFNCQPKFINSAVTIFNFQIEIEGAVYVWCWILFILHTCFNILGNKTLWLWDFHDTSCCLSQSHCVILHF